LFSSHVVEPAYFTPVLGDRQGCGADAPGKLRREKP